MSKQAEIADRKERFHEINEFVRARHGWLTSIPGDRDVELQTLPGSTLPAEVTARFGYVLDEVGETQRILPVAIVERFVRNTAGQLTPATIGSTRPIAELRHHAGIVRTRRFTFEL
jgi:hypothetical protein